MLVRSDIRFGFGRVFWVSLEVCTNSGIQITENKFRRASTPSKINVKVRPNWFICAFVEEKERSVLVFWSFQFQMKSLTILKSRDLRIKAQTKPDRHQ